MFCRDWPKKLTSPDRLLGMLGTRQRSPGHRGLSVPAWFMTCFCHPLILFVSVRPSLFLFAYVILFSSILLSLILSSLSLLLSSHVFAFKFVLLCLSLTRFPILITPPLRSVSSFRLPATPNTGSLSHCECNQHRLFLWLHGISLYQGLSKLDLPDFWSGWNKETISVQQHWYSSKQSHHLHLCSWEGILPISCSCSFNQTRDILGNSPWRVFSLAYFNNYRRHMIIRKIRLHTRELNSILSANWALRID